MTLSSSSFSSSYVLPTQQERMLRHHVQRIDETQRRPLGIVVAEA
eukprot:CAMPEP_0185818340 /NCGR_PEP_ID=MMETSP1322-20130828/20488_1 /TAXON_ID=265543 /ORGANISM="Minutocellus polymorphus, Strain RCC2270" /LENGTH=44 /DNA_ID= /DNA_START= /DNA_END= /DNA_ORIENTATION=